VALFGCLARTILLPHFIPFLSAVSDASVFSISTFLLMQDASMLGGKGLGERVR
jgi:hypothetical protein